MVGGDKRVGSWDGYVTRTVYSAMRRVMGERDCSEADALEALRTHTADWRRVKGMRKASHEAGRRMVEGLREVVR